MTEPDKKHLAAENPTSNSRQACAGQGAFSLSTPLPLIVQLVELSRGEVAEKLGQDCLSADPVLARAGRFAEVDLNSELLLPGRFLQVEHLTLDLFDSKRYRILINKRLTFGNSISLQGLVDDSLLDVFFLSETDKQVLATLRLPVINTIYMIKYICPAGKHYLCRGLITEVEQYTCEVKIHPRFEG